MNWRLKAAASATLRQSWRSRRDAKVDPRDREALERELVGKVADIRGILGGQVLQTSQILRRLLVSQLE